ncbi:beta-pore-forming protein unzipped [Megachile rotundata]|uniref:beta-pore-forming protein unzipped n=1 Tax=Megachile rotundata TaxID=143995 RepID=UPI000258E956|nr:PREDICTED: protein unzipped [Megachile rotundata]XP_012142144.1 PREDICTED: protein unzipped [Megachile rotundata]
MYWQRIYLAVGLIGVLLLFTNADNSVHILSKYHQLITSSTLNWLPRQNYDSSKEIVIGGFEIEEAEDDSHNNQAEKSERKRPLYVCRVLHTTVWVAGSQRGDERRCTVTIHGSVQSYEAYELLENMDNAARVNWEHWDKYKSTPIGAVATSEKMFVARHAVHNGKDETHDKTTRFTHYIGTLSSSDNLGTISYVKDDGTEGSAKSGDVLVETEPIYYDLNRVKLNWPKKRVMKHTAHVLGEATITNNGQEAANMAQAFGYTYKHSVYWSQGHAILKGLNSSITLTNGTSLPKIIWGTTETTNRTDVYTVLIYLEPGTGVNVTLRANYTDMEVPYSGTLISHYEDGETKSRVISGIRREESMFDITPEFGPIYFLSNYSLVPTTTVPPTTEATSTTPLPSTVSKDIHKQKMDDDDHDENLIVPPKKSDISNMQSDDGGPLSLKNKVDASHSGTCSFRLNAMFILSLTMIVHKVT